MSETGAVCSLKVWGEFACFTRPELKVERVSYPAPTPSAARGIFEAILYKPEFRWHIREISVLNPIRFITLRRNEVKGKISARNVEQAMKGKRILAPMMADDMDNEAEGRTQRQTLALRDAAYVLTAEIRVAPQAAKENPSQKFREQFLRRAARGQCFQQPYLGCREFAAHFEPASGKETPVDDSRELGWMLYDIFDLDAPAERVTDAKVLERVRRLALFEARLERGVMEVPVWESEAVKKDGAA